MTCGSPSVLPHTNDGGNVLALIQVNNGTPRTLILFLRRSVEVSMEHGRYWVALFNEGGENAGVERELARY